MGDDGGRWGVGWGVGCRGRAGLVGGNGAGLTGRGEWWAGGWTGQGRARWHGIL